jgi:hypothetical protein
MSIIIPTVLQMASDVMNWFTSMTCIYNRYWYAEQERITLPICVFHVKKITETWQNETSNKRVIMYEPPNAKPADTAEGAGADAWLADRLRPGVMQTITDNIVGQPKTYQMEVIIPFQPIGRYINEGLNTGLAIIEGIVGMFGESKGFDVVKSTFSGVQALFTTFNKVVETISKLPIDDTGGAAFINKNSLEAMAESGKVLTMKMWTGYQFKYVVITGMTIDKQPQEDGVFRGTLQLKEMPVLTMTVPDKPVTSAVTRSTTAKVITAVQGTLSRPLIALMNVDEASGEEVTDGSFVKKATGKIP